MPAAKSIAPEHYSVLSRVVQTPGCWGWDGYHNQYGYAVFRGAAGSSNRAAHRLIYGYYFGAVSPEVQVDHVCGNRGCVNPFHMRVTTPKQNTEHFVAELRSSNTSGYRGVSYDKARRRWRARVESNGVSRASYHATRDEAGAAARAMRLAMHTHNDRDRIVRGV